MGVPLISSFDSLITYPCIEHHLFLFKHIHPILITLGNIYFKYRCLFDIQYLNYISLGKNLFMERYLDCLDGLVARKYNKCTTLGHYMDKYSDVVFRVIMSYQCINIAYQYYALSYYWFAFVSLLVSCPGAYLLDYYKGHINSNMIVPKYSYSIYIEDNASLLCIFLPYLLYCITI